MKIIYTILLSLIVQIGFSQCYLDRHNTTWYDAWVSCNPSNSPNPARGQSHWLHYDLGYFYKLKDSKFWNANQPDFLNYGLKTIAIDYSIDGNNWTELGVFTLSEGTGFNIYEGETGPNFNDIIARYVLITVIDNYGGNCYSLSEVKINTEGTSIPLSYCPTDYNFSSTLLSDTYRVSHQIHANGLLQTNTNVVFKAAEINLTAGFEVKLGATFLGEIDPCQ